MEWLDRLNTLKKEAKKTNDDIAKLSGVPKSTVDKLFSGQTKDPQLSTIHEIVRSLGYTLDDLDTKQKNTPATKYTEVNNSIDEIVSLLQEPLVRLGFADDKGNISNEDFQFLIGIATSIDAYLKKGN